MGIFFSKKPAPQNNVSEHDRVVLKLKVQRDKLKQYQKKIEHVIEKERMKAKECLANKEIEKAKYLLRRKKRQEVLLRRAQGQMDNVEELTETIEFKQVEAKVLASIQEGSKTLENILDEINAETVGEVMDNFQDVKAQTEELMELTSKEFDPQDEADLEAEYNKLLGIEEGQTEATPEDLPSAPQGEVEAHPAESLPDVPETAPASSETERASEPQAELA